MSTDPGTMSARERAAHVRRTLIDIAKRRQKPGTGSAPFERGQAPMMQWPDLTGVLTGVRWAIAGAVATRQYMPERATRDLDVVIAANDATTAREKMQAAGLKMGRAEILPTEERTTKVHGLFNLLLALRLSQNANAPNLSAMIVSSDIAFNAESGRLAVLTGPNRGGKTTRARDHDDVASES